MTLRANRLAMALGYYCFPHCQDKARVAKDVCTGDHENTFQLGSHLTQLSTDSTLGFHSYFVDRYLIWQHVHGPFHGRVERSSRVQQPMPTECSLRNNTELEVEPCSSASNGAPFVDPPMSGLYHLSSHCLFVLHHPISDKVH